MSYTPLRAVISLAVAGLLGLTNTGCESCGFSFGRHHVDVTIVANVPPRAPRVDICSSLDGPEKCEHMRVPEEARSARQGVSGGTSSPLVYQGEAEPYGMFSCSIPRYRVVARADNCTKVEKVFEKVDAGRKEIRTPTEVQLTLTCEQ